MAKTRPSGKPSGDSYYVEKQAPDGHWFWIARNDPTKGWLVDPTVNTGAISYPIEYINWLFRASPPTAAQTRPSSTGRSSREIGGQALGTPKGLAYGQVLVAPSVFFGPRVNASNSNILYVGFGLSHGPCDSIVSTIFPHGKTLAYMTGYGGANPAWSQEFFPGVLNPAAASAHYRAAVVGSHPDTFERYPGLCHVSTKMLYYEVPFRGITTPYPIPKYVLKGRLVRNYVSGLDAWTDNPSYCTADYIVQRRYGRGAVVNVNSVIDAAAYCDETFLNSATGLNEKKHTLNYYMLRQAYHESHMDALRAHFRCNIIERGGEFIFVIDKDRAPVMAFDETTAIPVTVQRMGGLAIPNVVSVGYTDPADNYEVKRQYARTSGVEAGLSVVKSADYELEGFDRGSVAASEAFFLLNTRLNNLRVVLRAVHPKARRLLPNDVIEYTQSSFGMSGFLLRVIKVTRSADGTAWMIETVGHDPAIYGFQSRSVETYPVPELPDMYADLDAPADLTLTEVYKETSPGVFLPFVDVTFTPVDNPAAYGGTLIEYRIDGGAWLPLPMVDTGPLQIFVSEGPETLVEVRGKTMNRLTRVLGVASLVVSLTTSARPPAYPIVDPIFGDFGVSAPKALLFFNKPQIKQTELYDGAQWSTSGSVSGFVAANVSDGSTSATAVVMDAGSRLILDAGVGQTRSFRGYTFKGTNLVQARLEYSDNGTSWTSTGRNLVPPINIASWSYIDSNFRDELFKSNVEASHDSPAVGDHRWWSVLAVDGPMTITEVGLHEYTADYLDGVAINIYDATNGADPMPLILPVPFGYNASWDPTNDTYPDFAIGTGIDLTQYAKVDPTVTGLPPGHLGYHVAIRIKVLSKYGVESDPIDLQAFWNALASGDPQNSASLTASSPDTVANKAMDGSNTAVTQSPGDNSTKLATTEYADTGDAAVAAVIPEMAQDAVGTILADSTTIDFTYSDAIGPSITAEVKDASIGTVKLGGDVTAAGKALVARTAMFAIEITNTAGVIQHRIVGERGTATASAYAAAITGASNAYANTPTVGAGVGFTNGVGIDVLAASRIILDTAAQVDADHACMATIEFNTTATQGVLVTPRTVSADINGTTRNRLAVGFITAAGAAHNISTANIAAGAVIRIRVFCLF